MVANTSANSTAESARRGSSDSGSVKLPSGSVEISILLNSRSARRQTPRSGRCSSRLAAGAHRSSRQRLPQVRSRRRPPSAGVQCVAAAFRGFVYHHAHFTADHKSLEIPVRRAERTAATCSHCHQPVPGYDQLAERCFEFDRRARWQSDQSNELAQSRAEPQALAKTEKTRGTSIRWRYEQILRI
jgi:hypothetical protein